MTHRRPKFSLQKWRFKMTILKWRFKMTILKWQFKMTIQHDPKCLINDQNVILSELTDGSTNQWTDGPTQGRVPSDRTNPLRNGLTCWPTRWPTDRRAPTRQKTWPTVACGRAGAVNAQKSTKKPHFTKAWRTDGPTYRRTDAPAFRASITRTTRPRVDQ